MSRIERTRRLRRIAAAVKVANLILWPAAYVLLVCIAFYR